MRISNYFTIQRMAENHYDLRYGDTQRPIFVGRFASEVKAQDRAHFIANPWPVAWHRDNGVLTGDRLG